MFNTSIRREYIKKILEKFKVLSILPLHSTQNIHQLNLNQLDLHYVLQLFSLERHQLYILSFRAQEMN